MSQHNRDSFGTACGHFTYKLKTEMAGKKLSITQNTISSAQGWGANGCFHRESNLVNGKVERSIMGDGITYHCYPS